jgi:hypothetical protein
MVAPQDVPPVNELEQWVQTLMQDGITMVLLDIGTRGIKSNGVQ